MDEPVTIGYILINFYHWFNYRPKESVLTVMCWKKNRGLADKLVSTWMCIGFKLELHILVHILNFSC